MTIASLSDLEPIEQLSLLWAELRWAARAEGVIHLDDLLLRRVRIGLLHPEGGIPWIDRIRQIVQLELGWGDILWEKKLSVSEEPRSKLRGIFKGKSHMGTAAPKPPLAIHPPSKLGGILAFST